MTSVSSYGSGDEYNIYLHNVVKLKYTVKIENKNTQDSSTSTSKLFVTTVLDNNLQVLIYIQSLITKVRI